MEGTILVNIKIVKSHRILSWLLAFFSLGTILTGYASARKWIENYFTMNTVHKVFEWMFLAVLITHIILTSLYFKINWNKILNKTNNKYVRRLNIVKASQRITAWLILVSTIIVVGSGLNNYRWFAETLGQFKIFSLSSHRIADGILTFLILVHISLGFSTLLVRNRKAVPKYVIPTIVLSVILIAGTGYLEYIGYSKGQGDSEHPDSASIMIRAQTFSFNPNEVESIRPEIFQNRSFSVFDILVHLDDKGNISMVHHFDVDMNTYIIDTIDGRSDLWWYSIYYSGGWDERNVFRMDHYPWKEGATIKIFQYTSDYRLNLIYNTFQQEILRSQSNNGTIIIPEVEINGKTVDYTFTNVTVTAHNLRNDLFQEDIITAIDVIISLEEQGLINSYQLQWYDEIGTADIVRNYWVNGIDGDNAYGTCGFVYEAGDHDFDGFNGNHIHLPSDSRVINSPEYVLFFWICL